MQPEDGRIRCPVDINLDFFLTSHIDFLFIFGQCGDNCEYNLFLERKVEVTERPRSLNPGKATAMAIFPIIVYFNTKRARALIDDVACICVRSNKDAQKQIVRTSLNFHTFLGYCACLVIIG